MTISNPNCIVTVTGNNAQTVFDYGFLIPMNAGFELILTDLTTGNQTVLDTSLYSISGQGNPAGGTFTYPTGGSPIPATQTLTLIRQVANAQVTNFGNQDGYYPKAVEGALDTLAMQIQQLQAQVALCIQQPPVDLVLFNQLPAAFQRVNKKLGFDGNGQLALF